MPRSSEMVHRGVDATRIGPDPADPSASISLPDGDLGAGCYVEGTDPGLQGALLDSWCVQWAEAGYGFCYVHPGGTAPRELLARLPADRLDDVVWIDVDRSRVARDLVVPEDRRVTIDAFDAPVPDPATFELDPVNARVNAYLDAFSEAPEFDWNVARVLSSVLPAVFLRDDVGYADVGKALESKGLDDLAVALEDADERGRQALAVAKHAMDGPLDRARDPSIDAAWLLEQLGDAHPEDLLVGDGSYDIGRALLENDIVIVTGEALEPTGEDRPPARKTDRTAQLRTHVLVAALCCRLQEVAAFAPPASSMFPLVLDGFDDLLAGEGDLFQRLLRTSGDLPLAPIFSGPPPSELPEAIRLAIADHVATRVLVTDEETRHPAAEFDSATDSYQTAALGPGSMEAVERYVQREGLDSMPEAPLCWCRVDATARAAGVDAVHGAIQPAVVPKRPERRHPPEEVAATIARSIDRHGIGPT
ncbi:hypothetical protein HWV07_14720 [Natronomonas salina]|uniref:hypothetical protein n=1 Tax=Natronomonas salina TaxID=1710540 RepID=UPI0015B3DEB0|nr:hypothetical protein [Natronomonas salina]QLD90216.1 hypothetical protein HWV07_14720 [Natronomonas salina]